MKRLIGYGFVCTVMTVAGCGNETQSVDVADSRPVKLLEIEAGESTEVREFAGRVSASDVSRLSFRIGGEVIEVPVRNGQHVQAGDLIARLDSTSALSELTSAEAQHEVARADHQRKKKLLEQKLISRSFYDQAYALLVSSEAALRIARDRLSYTEIFAPYEGTIGKVSVEKHEVVAPNQTIATLQGESSIEITVQLPERIIANVRPQDEIADYHPFAWFTSDPTKTYLVTFKENAAEANPGSQTYDVTFTLPRPAELQLLPGMSAMVAIDLAKVSREPTGARVVVPTAAVVLPDEGFEPFVWRYLDDQGVVQRAPVQLGRVVDRGVEVVRGLSMGDRVVSAGVSSLKDGDAVTPWARERGL